MQKVNEFGAVDFGTFNKSLQSLIAGNELTKVAHRYRCDLYIDYLLWVEHGGETEPEIYLTEESLDLDNYAEDKDPIDVADEMGSYIWLPQTAWDSLDDKVWDSENERFMEVE